MVGIIRARAWVNTTAATWEAVWGIAVCRHPRRRRRHATHTTADLMAAPARKGIGSARAVPATG